MSLAMITRPAVGSPRSTPLLFIHGMMHGAWCWDAHFLDYFAQHGFAAYAVDLRGHGSSPGRDALRWTRISDFVDDVASVARSLPAAPVVIGHSMGGFIVQKYLEEHDAPGAVLLSSPPPSGLSGTALKIAFRSPLVFAKVNATFSLSPVIATPALARKAFFSADFPEEDLHMYWARMQDESYRSFLDMVALDLPRPAKVRARLLVLGAARDNMVSRRDIAKTAKAYRAEADIIPAVAHDSMLETRWQNAADRIRAWLDERRL